MLSQRRRRWTYIEPTLGQFISPEWPIALDVSGFPPKMFWVGVQKGTEFKKFAILTEMAAKYEIHFIFSQPTMGPLVRGGGFWPPEYPCMAETLCIITILYKYNTFCNEIDRKLKQHIFRFSVRSSNPTTKMCSLGYERVYQPLCEVADTPFHIQRISTISDCKSLKTKHC